MEGSANNSHPQKLCVCAQRGDKGQREGTMEALNIVASTTYGCSIN